jgi:hypothetical protein
LLEDLPASYKEIGCQWWFVHFIVTVSCVRQNIIKYSRIIGPIKIKKYLPLTTHVYRIGVTSYSSPDQCPSQVGVGMKTRLAPPWKRAGAGDLVQSCPRKEN